MLLEFRAIDVCICTTFSFCLFFDYKKNFMFQIVTYTSTTDDYFIIKTFNFVFKKIKKSSLVCSSYATQSIIKLYNTSSSKSSSS